MALSTLNRLTLIILSAIIVLGLFFVVFHFSYAQKIAPGVTIGDLKVGGLKQNEVEAFLSSLVGKYQDDGIVFSYKGQTVTISPVQEDANNIELSYELFHININEAARSAYGYAKNRGIVFDSIAKLESLILGKNFIPSYTMNQQAVIKILKNSFGNLETPAVDAALVYDAEKNIFALNEEKIGMTFDYDAALNEFHKNFLRLSYTPVTLKLISDSPKRKRADLLPALDKVNMLVGQLPIVFSLGEKKWEVDVDEFGAWLISKDGRNGPHLDIDKVATQNFFLKIKNEVNVTPKNAKFQITNGKVSEFSPSSHGLEIDVESALNQLRQNLSQETLSPIILTQKEVSPEITNDNVNTLGIKELLGVGQSSFAGSPANRRHNIKVGSDAVNGTLIAPNEEFSLLKVLGTIDASTGYLPELVIKGNKTIPEYGGGLCQVGTTTFRAAMAAGLPILERQNHSYSVSYYLEDGLPGTDATIYPPHPDMRFLNDTGHYILFQVRIEGDNLYYEIWGTKDGRVATRTKPVVWDKVAPSPTKLIETTDLKEGEKKCTERAHNGMKAKFEYTITYANGEKKQQTFSSTYRPWQEVCLIGVSVLTTSEDEVKKDELEE